LQAFELRALAGAALAGEQADAATGLPSDLGGDP